MNPTVIFSLSFVQEMAPKRKCDSKSGGPSTKKAKENAPAVDISRPEVDEQGYLKLQKNDVIEAKNGSKYKMIVRIGGGAFSNVYAVADKRDDEEYALKIVRNTNGCRNSAILEIRVLNHLKTLDPQGKYLSIQLLNTFEYHGHMCLLFEELGVSVHDFMRRNQYRPFPVDQTRFIAYQLCHAVNFLHANKITHTDLKPENLLFCDSDYDEVKVKGKSYRKVKNASIKLIDFGTATFDDEDHAKLISTRHYRAPEVIMELGWDRNCDLWSIGCILVELHTGNMIFSKDDDRQHLAMIETVLGKFPISMAKKTKTKYFKNGKLASTKAAERIASEHCKPLKKYFSSTAPGLEFHDLTSRMLKHEPNERIGMGEALEHQYFKRLPKKQRDSVLNGPTKENRVGK